MSDIYPPANWPIPQRRWRHQQGHAPTTNEVHPSARWKQQDRAGHLQGCGASAQSRQVQAVPATHIRRQHIASGAARNESRRPARASMPGNASSFLWIKTAELTRCTPFTNSRSYYHKSCNDGTNRSAPSTNHNLGTADHHRFVRFQPAPGRDHCWSFHAPNPGTSADGSSCR